MKRIPYLILLAAASLTLCACKSYVTVPPPGTKFDYKELEADSKGRFIMKLKGCDGLVYRGFIIERTADSPLNVEINRNSPEHAFWRVDPADFDGQSLICTADRNVLPPAVLPKTQDAQSLWRICRVTYGGVKDTAKFTITETTRQGLPAADYILRVTPVNEPAFTVHGFLVYAKDEPGVVLDVRYQQWDGGKNTLVLRDLGERFLNSVKVTEP